MPTRRPNPWLRPAAAVLLAALAAGCRGGPSSGGTTGGGGPDGRLTGRGDPILGRIPPQNLPVPGKDAYGRRERKDPLLVAPGSEEPAKTVKGTTGGGKEGESASRTRSGPYLPGRESTNAALAGHLEPDDADLSIGDRRPPGTTTGGPAGPVKFQQTGTWGTAGGQTYDQLAADLKRLNGATPAAALRQALDQVRDAKAGK